MNNYEKLTRQQAEDKMETYRELYTVVRLLDEEHLLGLNQGKETGDIPESCQCYAYWNKKSPCENCISLQAFHDKARKTKLEFMDQDIFQVTSNYLEVDGKSCVMELVQRLDDTTLIDTEGRKKLIEKADEIKQQILIVDDSEVNREILTEILHTDYRILEAANGQECIDKLRHYGTGISVVLLDIIMPQMDGFDVLNAMEANNWLDDIPVIVISGANTKETERQSLTMGASDFVKKPFDEAIVCRRVHNIVDLYDYKRRMEQKTKEQEQTLRRQYGMLLQQAKRIKQNNERIIDVLGIVVEYRGLESGEHIQRVKDFTAVLAREVMKEYPEYGLTQKRIEQIVSIADAYDALVSERVYTPEEAFHMIISGECGVFSPKLMECFRTVRAEYMALARGEKSEKQ